MNFSSVVSSMARSCLVTAGLLMAISPVYAGEKKLLHCFAFTAVESASQADWDAFGKATDALPKKITGVSKVWYGKLARPVKMGDDVRQYGVCMEMADAAALKAYASDPYHKEWGAAYEKVRAPGTNTFDILGQ